MSGRSLLLMSGSLRDASINSTVIRTLAELSGDDVDVHVYDELGALPHFDPDVEAAQPPESVLRLRAAIEERSAVLICTPEYAGSLPGSFKNLLDWTVGGMEIVGKPTAWINASASSTQAAGAHAALRTVLTYTGASIVEDACRHVPTGPADRGADGTIVTEAIRSQLREALTALLAAADDEAGDG